MAYIGRPLNTGNLAVQSGTGDGSDTTPISTLDHSVGSSNSVAVYLDGVRQLAGTDFTAVGTTLTFTTAPASGVGIDVYFLGLELSIPTPADATVAKAKITTTLINEHVDTTITAADSILFSDATDSNANKKDTVQGILDLAGGGAWNIIGTNEFSSTTSVTITGLDSTYDTYAIALSNCTIATDHNNVGIRLGDASGVDSGTADYSFHTGTGNSGSTSYASVADADTDYIFYNSSMGNATGEGAGLMIYLHRPGDGAVFPIISGTHVTVKNDGTTSGGAVTGQRLSVITVDRINLYERGGANMSGRLTVYGIAHA